MRRRLTEKKRSSELDTRFANPWDQSAKIAEASAKEREMLSRPSGDKCASHRCPATWRWDCVRRAGTSSHMLKWILRSQTGLRSSGEDAPKTVEDAREW